MTVSGPMGRPYYNVKSYSWPSKEKDQGEGNLKGEQVIAEEQDQQSPPMSRHKTIIEDYMDQPADEMELSRVFAEIEDVTKKEIDRKPELKGIINEEIEAETDVLKNEISQFSIDEVVQDLKTNPPKDVSDFLKKMEVFFQTHREKDGEVLQSKEITPGQTHILFLSLDRTVVEALVAEEICRKAGLIESPLLEEITKMGHLISPALMGLELAAFASIINQRLKSIHSKENELNRLDPEKDKGTIARIKHEIKTRKDEIKSYAPYITWKIISYATGAPKQILQYMVESGQVALLSSHLSTVLLAASTLSAIGVLSSFCFQTFYTAKTLIGFKNTFKEINELNDKLNSYQEDDPMYKIIKARIDRLEHLKKEGIFNSVRMTAFTFLSSISVGIAIKAVLVGMGVTIGATATVAISVTGYGVIIIGGILIISGAGYLAYTQRHEIEAFMKKIPLTARRYYTTLKIKQAQNIIEKSRKRIEQISKEKSDLKTFNKTYVDLGQIQGDDPINQNFRRMLRSRETINKLNIELNFYKVHQEMISYRKEWKGVEQKLKTYKQQDLEALKKDIETALKDEDQAREIKAFLQEKKAVPQEEEITIKWEDVLKYITA